MGALKYLFFSGERRAPLWEIICPVLGTAYLVFVFYKQVIPVPAAPYNIFPYLAAAWMLLAVVIILARPALASRIGENLVRVDDDTAAETTPAQTQA